MARVKHVRRSSGSTKESWITLAGMITGACAYAAGVCCSCKAAVVSVCVLYVSWSIGSVIWMTGGGTRSGIPASLYADAADDTRDMSAHDASRMQQLTSTPVSGAGSSPMGCGEAIRSTQADVDTKVSRDKFQGDEEHVDRGCARIVLIEEEMVVTICWAYSHSFGAVVETSDGQNGEFPSFTCSACANGQEAAATKPSPP